MIARAILWVIASTALRQLPGKDLRGQDEDSEGSPKHHSLRGRFSFVVIIIRITSFVRNFLVDMYHELIYS